MEGNKHQISFVGQRDFEFASDRKWEFMANVVLLVCPWKEGEPVTKVAINSISQQMYITNMPEMM